MADQFTKVTTTGYGSRITNSISKVLIGLILFVVSFGVLYWNEGRVDLSNIAKTAAEISSSSINSDSSLNGKLVSTTGVVNSNEIIGDNLFLNPGKFIAVERKVEMYSWVEVKKNTTSNNTGGSSTTTTTYSYKEDWEENPGDSSGFQYPDGHQNPQKSLDSYTGHVLAATVGVYNFDPSSVTLPPFIQVQLNSQNTTLSKNAILVNDSYLFISSNNGSTFENPAVGDLRVSYYVLNNGINGTIFGALNGNNIEPYSDQKGNNLYRLFAGTRDQAISTLHSEYELWLWIFRLIGFLAMWFGLLLLFAPIITLLDILPILGEITGVLIGIATFLVALVLSIVTIVVSMILHSIVALIIALVIAIAIIISAVIFLREKKKTGSKPVSPSLS